MTPRIYLCDHNPRMRQLIEQRLAGHAEVVGAGSAPEDAIAANRELEPDAIILDFRTAVGRLEQTVAAIKDARPSTAVIVHTGVPRELIADQVEAAGAVYSAKNEPDHLVGLVRSVRPAAVEAASRDS
jgi:DNA-binding NarL/FixJ family response regulator